MSQEYPLPQQDYKVLIRCYTYNHEKYIEDALKGFVMQKTDFPFVAVVVDDASTDGTADIIRKYADEYPDIIKAVCLKENHYSQKKKKVPYIQPWRERCEYEAICEGDDYWIDPTKLQKQVDFLDRHPDYVLSYTNAIIVNANNRRILTNKSAGKNGPHFHHLLFKCNPIITAGTCFRLESYQKARQLLNKVRLKSFIIGDYPLWVVFSTLGHFHYLSDKMIAYRVLQNSASHSSDYKRIEAFFKEEAYIKSTLYQHFTQKTAMDLFEKHYYRTVIRKMAEYDRTIFMKFYKEGVCKYPSLFFNSKLMFFLIVKNLHIL